MELDREVVARIQARARHHREIIDEYNAEVLREQGIEPTEDALQEMCCENIDAALAAERKRRAN